MKQYNILLLCFQISFLAFLGSACRSVGNHAQPNLAKGTDQEVLDVSVERISTSPILKLFSDWSERAMDPQHLPECEAEKRFVAYSRKLGEHCAAAVVAGQRDASMIMAAAKKHGEMEQMYLIQSLIDKKYSADDIAFAIFCLETDFERNELPVRIRNHEQEG